MEPDDDPERRIRELERPLADSARMSEFGGAPSGGQPYPPPPGPVPPPLTPSPYNYGGPFLGPSPGSPSSRSSGTRIWWILAAVFIVAVLALVGGIATFAAHRISGGNVVVTSPTPSTSRVSNPPGSSPRSTSPPTSSTEPAGGKLSVSGIGENKTIACNDSVVTVSGISNTIVITGHCASLRVSGMKNSVTVDAADTIDASGLNNQVTYHTGAPKISKSGQGNVVQQG